MSLSSLRQRWVWWLVALSFQRHTLGSWKSRESKTKRFATPPGLVDDFGFLTSSPSQDLNIIHQIKVLRDCVRVYHQGTWLVTRLARLPCQGLCTEKRLVVASTRQYTAKFEASIDFYRFKSTSSVTQKYKFWPNLLCKWSQIFIPPCTNRSKTTSAPKGSELAPT